VDRVTIHVAIRGRRGGPPPGDPSGNGRAPRRRWQSGEGEGGMRSHRPAGGSPRSEPPPPRSCPASACWWRCNPAGQAAPGQRCTSAPVATVVVISATRIRMSIETVSLTRKTVASLSGR
jgi:hypothetical protein